MIMWEDMKLVIINHLGMNPKNGGSPPNLNIINIIIINEGVLRFNIEFDSFLKIILNIIKIDMRVVEIVM